MTAGDEWSPATDVARDGSYHKYHRRHAIQPNFITVSRSCEQLAVVYSPEGNLKRLVNGAVNWNSLDVIKKSEDSTSKSDDDSSANFRGRPVCEMNSFDISSEHMSSRTRIVLRLVCLFTVDLFPNRSVKPCVQLWRATVRFLRLWRQFVTFCSFFLNFALICISR